MSNPPTYQFCTEEDFKRIADAQARIGTDVAVATNDLRWIIENYKNQCKEIERIQSRCDDLAAKYNTLKGDVMKYIGIAIGATAVISLLISLLNLGRLIGLGG
jgi:tetrahydromethanopterin S-methyltransferase subunit G